MKSKHREITKEGKGYIVLLPEEPEDMWHAYNLIAVGDLVKSTTIRRIQSETATGTKFALKIFA
jgi:protein pelota